MTAILIPIAATAAAILAIILASRLRFAATATWRGRGERACEYRCSYIHPAILTYARTSSDAKRRLRIFGIWIGCTNTNDCAAADNCANTNTAASTPPDLHTTVPAWAAPPAQTRRARRTFVSRAYSRITGAISRARGHAAFRIMGDKPLRSKLLKWTTRLPARLAAAAVVEELKLRVAAGCENPADTARLYGCVAALRAAAIPRGAVYDVSVTPVFTEKRLEAEVKFAVKTTAARLVVSAAAILLSFPFYRLYKVSRAPKKRTPPKKKSKPQSA